MTHITSCRNISIEHLSSAVFVAFRLVLPFRERTENFIRLNKNIIVLYLQISTHKTIEGKETNSGYKHK